MSFECVSDKFKYSLIESLSMNLSRRAMILSIALALGVGAYFKFAEESYSSFYRSHLEKNRREIISREEFLESYAPTQEERLTLDEKILSS